MQQLTQRAALNYRWPVLPHRRVDVVAPYDPYGWDSPPARTPHSRIGRIALGRLATAATTAQGVGTGITAATPVITTILATHAAATAAATGSAASILGLSASVAIPIIGAALLGATILITSLIKNSGCGQTCVITSQWANQAATALQQNLDAYRSLPTPRTRAQQSIALANFDAIWAALQAQCGQPGTGDAGVRCITDRQQGACKWKNGDACWNWFIGYRDPIASDAVVDTPTDLLTSAGDSAAGAVSTFLGSKNLLLWLGAGLLVLGAMGD